MTIYTIQQFLIRLLRNETTAADSELTQLVKGVHNQFPTIERNELINEAWYVLARMSPRIRNVQISFYKKLITRLFEREQWLTTHQALPADFHRHERRKSDLPSVKDVAEHIEELGGPVGMAIAMRRCRYSLKQIAYVCGILYDKYKTERAVTRLFDKAKEEMRRFEQLFEEREPNEASVSRLH